MPEASVLKLGLLNPLPRKLIEEFAAKVDKLYIFEELEPVVEEQVKAWGIQKAVGKEIFKMCIRDSIPFIRDIKGFRPVLQFYQSLGMGQPGGAAQKDRGVVFFA